MTGGGGHAYELGVGKAPVAYGRLPSVQEMVALFEHESTRFIGRADLDVVSLGYLELRAKLEAYDKEHVSKFTLVVDYFMTSSDKHAGKARVDYCCTILVVLPLISLGAGIVFMVVGESVIYFMICVFLGLFVPIVALIPLHLTSRILRAHIAAAFGYGSRDSLEYTFHCSLRKPPFRFRQRTAPLLIEGAIPSESGVELAIPACFLPRDMEQAVPIRREGASATTARARGIVSQLT